MYYSTFSMFALSFIEEFYYQCQGEKESWHAGGKGPAQLMPLASTPLSLSSKVI